MKHFCLHTKHILTPAGHLQGVYIFNVTFDSMSLYYNSFINVTL